MSVKRNAERIYLAVYAGDHTGPASMTGEPVMDASGHPVVDSNRAECLDRANDATNRKVRVVPYDRRALSR